MNGFMSVLTTLSGVAFALLLVWIMLAFFTRTRKIAGIAIITSTYLWALELWLVSAATVFALWGWIGFLIGVALFGFGVVPLAAIALALNGRWNDLGALAVFVVIIAGLRFVGIALTAASGKASRLATLEASSSAIAN